jgi:peptidoglycan/xylan/chitin deacetylase (PgdA/CDA1 family)
MKIYFKHIWGSSIFALCLAFIILCSLVKTSLSDRPIVVLTFDDAVKSHLSFVAPMLKEYGYSATFFVTYAWMDDTLNFMSWKDVKMLDSMGFEIGNHSWTHGNFSQPKQAFELEGELGMIESVLQQYGISKPISYAHTGNAFGPEAIAALSNLGYQFARRGKQPEVEYGSLAGGQGYDPMKHHPLLIPTTIDFYPGMNLNLFQQALENIRPHEITVLQFHGVPDIAHPWVSTLEDDFRQYLDYLRDHHYDVIAMRDLQSYLPAQLPDDPMLKQRYPEATEEDLDWPIEVEQSRDQKVYWMEIMKRHRFTQDEMALVLGAELEDLEDSAVSDFNPSNKSTEQIEVMPFPGGRHPRVDFKEGMLSPRRGTKLSVFLPWDPDDYIVLDLPEAIFTQYGLTFLGHKHIPTIFDMQKLAIPNVDWKRDSTGNWTNLWSLHKQVEIGVKVTPMKNYVLMHLALTNNTADTIFRELQTQVCLMLGEAKNFAQQTNENKRLNCPVVAVEAKDERHWILTGWEGCAHPWGNEDCPCLHADPMFPDCAPGQTVSINGVLWFYAGDDVDEEIIRVRSEFKWL